MPGEVRQRLAQFQERLRSRIPEHVSWVAPDQFHITLKFLGPCDRPRLMQLQTLLSESRFPPTLTLTVVSLIPLPERGLARILAAQVWESTGDLLWVRNTLECVAERVGIRSNRERLEPHITLGHVRPPQRIRGWELLEYGADDWQPMQITADRVDLVESILSAEGSSYRRIGALRLPAGSKPGPATFEMECQLAEQGDQA